ncbi:MAG: hypothetical protein MI673_06350 [Thiotrichales bacterium]|nr:hypothetical protein [Thiotrichales bacterium]
MSVDTLLIMSLLIPAAGALLILVNGARPNLREACTLISAVLLFINVCMLYRSFSTGNSAQLTLFEPLPGLSISLAVEALGILFALIASFLWIVTSVYAIAYMRSNRESSQTRFYVCFARSMLVSLRTMCSSPIG